MKLRHSDKSRVGVDRTVKRSLLSRLKGKVLGAVLITGLAVGAVSCKTADNKASGKTNSHQVQKKPKADDNLVFDGCKPSDYDCECSKYPAIEKWAKKRSLDPLLVRAFIKTESAFQPHAAAKVCGPGYDEPGCFQMGPSADLGYQLAFDEMYVPEGTRGKPSQLVNDNPGAGKAPRWRWLSFGLMQNLEPPVSFWPASHRADGTNGKYYDLFKSAGISSAVNLDAAKACNPQFNPFDVDDSLCVGTARLASMFRGAKHWVQNPPNKITLNWDVDTDQEKTDLFVAYIVANKYSGLWDMTGNARVGTSDWPTHPRCTADMTNGDCWAIGFRDSWQAKPGVPLDKKYCSGSEGQADTMRCKDGKPRKEAPVFCYGYTDFLKFVQDCEVPFLPTKADSGAVKIRAYLDLKQRCK